MEFISIVKPKLELAAALFSVSKMSSARGKAGVEELEDEEEVEVESKSSCSSTSVSMTLLLVLLLVALGLQRW